MDGHPTRPTGSPAPAEGLPEDPSLPTADPVPDDVPPSATPEDTLDDETVHRAEHEHDDALADEWGRESFPSSDPPGHY